MMRKRDGEITRWPVGSFAFLCLLAGCGETHPAGEEAETRDELSLIRLFSTLPGYHEGGVGLTLAAQGDGFYFMYAHFFDERPKCTHHPIGEDGVCGAFECPEGGEESDGAPISAGDIEFEGTLIADTTLRPNRENRYEAIGGAGQLWEAGQHIAVTSTGAPGGFPPFYSVSVGPPSAVLTSPSWDAVDGQVVDRSAPLEIAWTYEKGGADLSDVSIWLGLANDDLTRSVFCFFPIAEDAAVVRPDVLAWISKGSGRLFFNVTDQNFILSDPDAEDGPRRLITSLQVDVLLPNGEIAGTSHEGRVTFE